MQLNSRARFPPKLQKKVAAQGGTASRLAGEPFCGSAPRAVGLDAASWKKGRGSSEHFKKPLTAPRGSLAEHFQDEPAFGLMDLPANTQPAFQTAEIYFHSKKTRLCSYIAGTPLLILPFHPKKVTQPLALSLERPSTGFPSMWQQPLVEITLSFLRNCLFWVKMSRTLLSGCLGDQMASQP